jgi:hypothetical protein
MNFQGRRWQKFGGVRNQVLTLPLEDLFLIRFSLCFQLLVGFFNFRKGVATFGFGALCVD